MTPTLDGPRFNPRAGGSPEALVVLLHGYGSNGEDLIQLAPHVSQNLPRVQFVSPDAPFPLDVPGAPANGRQWFPISRIDPDELEAGVRSAAPILDAFLDQELTRYRLAPERLALVGFSQGAMLAMHVGPRRATAPFALVGMSGTLCGAAALKDEIASHPPVLLVHGDRDPVVAPGLMLESAKGLSEAGLGVRWKLDRGVPHAVGPEGLALVGDFLARSLARGPLAVACP